MRRRKILANVIIAAVLGILIMGTYGILTAEEYDPTNFEVILHRTDLYANSSDTTPEPVFDAAGAGVPVDLVTNPGSVFGSGDVAVGTYRRMSLTLGNLVSVAGTNPCNGSAYMGTFLINDSLPADAQTHVFFATAEDGGDSIVTADGTSSNPFLMQSPIVVEEGETTVVRLAFYTSGSLVCIGGVDVQLRPPTVAVASYIEGTEPVVNPEGDYWFAHFNVNTHLFDEETGDWIDPGTATADVILNRIGASTGWGSLTLGVPDGASGIGSWAIANESWRNGGFGEHRHNFARWDVSSDECYAGTAPNLPMQGTCQVTGNQIFVSLGSSPTMEGYVAEDGSSFILVNIGGVDDSDVVFAVKKSAGAFTNMTDGPYVIVSPQISFNYDTAGASPYPATGVEFDGQVIILRGPDAGDDVFSWGTQLELEYESTGGIIGTVNGAAPMEDAEMSTGISSYLVFGSDGLATTTPDDNTLFIAMGGDNTSGQLGLFAGMAAAYDPSEGEHRLSNGFIVQADPSPDLTKLEGRWALMGVNWGGDDGDDGIWYTGDEDYELLLSYGTLDIDGSGNVTYSILDKDIVSQAVDYGTGSGSMEVVTEYYAPNNPLYTNSSSAIPITLYALSEPAGSSTVVARLVLDKRGNTFVFWSPMDEGNVPENDGSDPAEEFSMGVGVKIE